ncbi:MAG: hypothetical protein ACPGUX_05710, partial [Halocynthiibacter sp.]
GEISKPDELCTGSPSTVRKRHRYKLWRDKVFAARKGSIAFARQWFEKDSNNKTSTSDVFDDIFV